MSDALARAVAAALELARDFFRAKKERSESREAQIEDLQSAITAGDQAEVSSIWNRWNVFRRLRRDRRRL